MKYKVITWGCQMNVHDSEVISGMLEKMGYVPAEGIKDADILILNTCSVRETAEQKVYGRLGQLKPLKQNKPNMIIAITGCMIQQPHVVDFIKDKYPFVDIIFGIHNVSKLPQLIETVNYSNYTIVETIENETWLEEGLPYLREDNIKAWVTITYGCNNFCTYCIVPYVRGRERSRKPADIINEVKSLAEKGVKEINLLGQNVNSYGKDLLDERITFAQLLYELNKIKGIERIRFTTSHPKDLSNELIFAMRDLEKICEHIHLPIQAGSNKILKLMNRNYTREHYLELIQKLRDEIPEIAISTDIIVGFPGETEEDFLDTLDIVQKVQYDQAFMFMYSKRKGTPAAEMENQVEEEVKKDRLERLMKLQDSISAKKNEQMKEKLVEVLVEGYSKKDKGKLTGRTRTNKIVNFKGSESLIGQLVMVKIVEPHTFSLFGELYNFQGG
ncbi:tRNA (N6-isopentenyl adenosine(37)-C2)-methylthiotransferase MiaB [Thermovenabulum gondwanense]|uniref:tRNA-2-methylthio-N(6)-dimethylallyladenosine synthase n=1 Tax=Thermovenabulum gondwanense TaxID=520767 RepID=A0A161Q257_9FIRM|nr:tRNA (N6-isopentenyl adenosine(37)-C2)-methylthiotransferase MiaB [Thermovenabulum gondwanense]KYO64456.1 tRNA-2-methylthio-N(6)-dimethylallyladenosine synthase [Thermovenabulum gondwanense]